MMCWQGGGQLSPATVMACLRPTGDATWFSCAPPAPGQRSDCTCGSSSSRSICGIRRPIANTLRVHRIDNDSSNVDACVFLRRVVFSHHGEELPDSRPTGLIGGRTEKGGSMPSKRVRPSVLIVLFASLLILANSATAYGDEPEKPPCSPVAQFSTSNFSNSTKIDN